MWPSTGCSLLLSLRSGMVEGHSSPRRRQKSSRRSHTHMHGPSTSHMILTTGENGLVNGLESDQPDEPLLSWRGRETRKSLRKKLWTMSTSLDPIHIILCHPHNNSERSIFFFPYYPWEDEGLERLSNLLKVTQQVFAIVGVEGVAWPKKKKMRRDDFFF